jgi:adenylate cyclase
LGEVVISDNTVTGAGVVLAQRVEQLAEPGGVCITGAVHEAVPQHLNLDYSDLGKREAKGFDEPVQVYSASVKSGARSPVPEPGVSMKARSRKPKQLRTAGAIALLVAVIGTLGWLYFDKPEVEPASISDMAFPLPEKPSIAVLPFDNLSGDADQEYLADGLTEDIITVLAKIPNLFVIARNSTFIYKGKAVSVKQVAEEQGVHYVLEGSIQRSGDRIRINAQLIDAMKGHHVWAERYDREFKDIFALQDDIAQNILTALHVKLVEGEDFRVMRARTSSPEAFEYLMKSRVHWLRVNKDDNAIGRQLVAKAAEISPDSPEIWLYMAWHHFREYRHWWSGDREASLNSAEELALKAYAADPSDSATNGLLGVLSLARGRYDDAISYAKKSVELAPSSATDKARLAWILCYAGYPEEAIPLLQQAMRLSPYYPAWMTATLGLAYMMTENYDKAIATHEQLLERKSLLQFGYSRLAGINAILGNKEKAEEFAAELLRIKPKFTVRRWARVLLYQNPDDLERELNALRMAGLPEG